jgi:hypothetical protein
MPVSAQTPDPGLSAGSVLDGSAPTLGDTKAKPRAREESRWSVALRPLPAIVNQLEKRALAVTVLLFTFLALKVTVVAKGDIPTAQGIFQTANPAVTAIGALLSGLPLGAVAVLVVFGYRAAKDASRESGVLAAVAALACFFIAPWPVFVASALAGPVAGYTMRQRQRLRQTPGRRWQTRGTLLILLPCLAIFGYVTCVTTWRVMYDVWLPHEAITLQSGQVVVGYVLSDNGNWISILRTGQRRIVLYQETQVRKRAECPLHRHGPLADLTAWQMLGPRAYTASGEPDCP